MKGMLTAEAIRFCNVKKIIIVMVAFVCILLAGEYENIRVSIAAGGSSGIVHILWRELAFDRSKIVLVLLLNFLYVNSFCQDDRSHYCRMILNRTEVVCYVQARFIVNAVGTVLVSILCFFLAAGILSMFLPLVEQENFQIYYAGMANKYPMIFIAFMGMQFGLLSAAFGSIGLLLSVFQPDAFVCIAMTGLIFFISSSYIPENSVFNVLDIISLAPGFTKSPDGSRIIDISWGILYPVCVIGICGYLFDRRLRWRYADGSI